MTLNDPAGGESAGDATPALVGNRLYVFARPWMALAMAWAI